MFKIYYRSLCLGSFIKIKEGKEMKIFLINLLKSSYNFLKNSLNIGSLARKKKIINPFFSLPILNS